MTRWMFNITELVISIIALIGTSLVDTKAQPFYIEQFIILMPHILNYIKISILNERYIRRSHHILPVIIVGVLTCIVLAIAFLSLFLSISPVIKLTSGSIILTDWIIFSHNITILPFSIIIFINIIIISIIDTYTIRISNNAQR